MRSLRNCQKSDDKAGNRQPPRTLSSAANGVKIESPVLPRADGDAGGGKLAQIPFMQDSKRTADAKEAEPNAKTIGNGTADDADGRDADERG